MTALQTAQQYFDAWNRRDAAAILATFAEGGMYCDPSTGGRLRGAALGGYLKGLWAAFPDVSFEIVSAGETARGLVAAQWLMRGTNTGPIMGLPATGKTITLAGADFIRVADDKIELDDRYFDTCALPEQLGFSPDLEAAPLGFGFAPVKDGASIV